MTAPLDRPIPDDLTAPIDQSRQGFGLIAVVAGSRAVVVVIVLIAAAVLTSLWWLLGVAVLAGAAVFALVASRLLAEDGSALVRQLGAVPSPPGAWPRAESLLANLAAAAGVPVPALAVIDSAAANLLTVGRSADEATVVATRGLLEGLERIELEAVLAREIVRVHRGDLPSELRSVLAMARLGGTDSPLGRRVHPYALDRGELVMERDADTFALTRYPAALAAALDRLATMDTAVPTAPDVTGFLWLADPGCGPWATWPDLARRADSQREW